ncbi:hypothetical protein MOBT1_001038 [Malassezia obtusa]|uniref:Mitochondrial import protein 1 n=1 Tax=Malassezia obtusa TaxID=76774 RepID=A0AAF0DY62_9BASI|nr:hypothetical protein MOBT1_001038 [Malassezia obtusa]
MLSRAPHAAEARPQEEIGELAGVPEWANRAVHPVLAEAVPQDEFAAQEASETDQDQELMQDETQHEQRAPLDEQLDADSDVTEKADEDEKDDIEPDVSEKEHLFDDISISDGEPEPEPVDPAPTGELTLAAICAPKIPWTRRLLLISATLAINVGLPFINGVFLGFGEIFARAFIAPWLGLAPPLLNYNPYSPSPADVPPLSTIPPGGLRSWAKGVKERAAEEQD